MTGKRAVSLAGLVLATFAAVLITVALGDRVSASGEDDETIYKVEGDVQQPVRLSGDAPVYPEEARQERAEGRVVILAVIGRDGAVTSTEIVEAERQDLAEAAATAIEGWKFEPATLEGEPVSVYYHLTVQFRLDADKPESA